VTIAAGATGVTVVNLNGTLAVVITSVQATATLADVLDRVSAARERAGQVPLLDVVDTAQACRRFSALQQLTAVPRSEPRSDGRIPAPTEWLTTAQVSRWLGVSARAVTKRITTGALAARKVGGRWQIDSKELARGA